MTATTAIGLGKGIGLLFVWIGTKLREHYNPKDELVFVSKELDSANALFFDKDYIRNLSTKAK